MTIDLLSPYAKYRVFLCFLCKSFALIFNHEKAHRISKFSIKPFRTNSFRYLSVFLLNLKLTIMFNWKYIFCFHGPFFEEHWYALQAVVRTFPCFFFGYFRKCLARSEKLVYDNYGLWLGKPSPGKKLFQIWTCNLIGGWILLWGVQCTRTITLAIWLAPLAYGQQAYVMACCLSCVSASVRALTFSLNIFSKTTYWILMKFHRNVPGMVLFRISWKNLIPSKTLVAMATKLNFFWNLWKSSYQKP